MLDLICVTLGAKTDVYQILQSKSVNLSNGLPEKLKMRGTRDVAWLDAKYISRVLAIKEGSEACH